MACGCRLGQVRLGRRKAAAVPSCPMQGRSAGVWGTAQEGLPRVPRKGSPKPQGLLCSPKQQRRKSSFRTEGVGRVAADVSSLAGVPASLRKSQPGASCLTQLHPALRAAFVVPGNPDLLLLPPWVLLPKEPLSPASSSPQQPVRRTASPQTQPRSLFPKAAAGPQEGSSPKQEITHRGLSRKDQRGTELPASSGHHGPKQHQTLSPGSFIAIGTGPAIRQAVPRKRVPSLTIPSHWVDRRMVS